MVDHFLHGTDPEPCPIIAADPGVTRAHQGSRRLGEQRRCSVAGTMAGPYTAHNGHVRKQLSAGNGRNIVIPLMTRVSQGKVEHVAGPVLI